MNATSSGATTEHALKAITLQNQINSPFLRLPAEIRNKIYDYILRYHRIVISGPGIYGIQVDDVVRKRTTHAHFPIRLLRLLEVCQQIYAEARLLTFSLNPLFVDYPGCFSQFLADDWLDSSQEAAITRLETFTYIPFYCGMRGNGEQWLDNILRNDLKCLRRLPRVKKIVVQFVKYQGDTVQEEVEAKAKQEIQEAVRLTGGAIHVEYQGLLLERRTG